MGKTNYDKKYTATEIIDKDSSQLVINLPKRKHTYNIVIASSKETYRLEVKRNEEPLIKGHKSFIRVKELVDYLDHVVSFTRDTKSDIIDLVGIVIANNLHFKKIGAKDETLQPVLDGIEITSVASANLAIIDKRRGV